MAANESSKPMRAKQPANTSRPLQRRMLRASGAPASLGMARRERDAVESRAPRRQRVVAVREEDEAEGAREERESRGLHCERAASQASCEARAVNMRRRPSDKAAARAHGARGARRPPAATTACESFSQIDIDARHFSLDEICAALQTNLEFSAPVERRPQAGLVDGGRADRAQSHDHLRRRIWRPFKDICATNLCCFADARRPRVASGGAAEQAAEPPPPAAAKSSPISRLSKAFPKSSSKRTPPRRESRCCVRTL